MIHIKHDPSDLTILINWQSKLIDDPHWLTNQIEQDPSGLTIQVDPRLMMINVDWRFKFIQDLSWLTIKVNQILLTI